MANKENFIKMVEFLLEDEKILRENIECEDILNKDFQEGLQYFEVFKKSSDSKGVEMTEKGKTLLLYMQNHREEDINLWTAKSLAEGMDASSRTISGCMRKLVSDGYVEKVGSNPAHYSLTEKGINFNF